MAGTFSSLSTALSALRYNQVAMDVASGNVANSGTTGYARRQVIAQATGAPAVQALWSRWDGAGDGVEAGRVDRMVDALLDARVRTEHASSSALDARATSLTRFETALGEPGDNGIAAALSDFKAAWHGVANAPDDSAARGNLLAKADTLQSTIANQAKALGTEWSDQHDRLQADVTEVNQTASDLDKLNKALRNAHLSGTDAGNLLDQRDLLTLKLAELTGATTSINKDSTVNVMLGGQSLVNGDADTGPVGFSTITINGATKVADASASPVTLSVGGNTVSLDAGEMAGQLQVLNDDLPDYGTKLDGFVQQLVDAVNSGQAAGNELGGARGTDFFSGTTAASLAVKITNINEIAAAGANNGKLDGNNADAMTSLDMGEASYRNLITTFGVSVASASQVSANQNLLTAQVDAAQESVSGISVDEEMVNLLAAQRGYEGASRVLTTLDSVLDTLINRTGVTR